MSTLRRQITVMSYLIGACTASIHANPLKERCQALMQRIGAEQVLRLKNDRTYIGQQLLRKLWIDHFTNAHQTQTSFRLPADIADHTKKFLEMQQETFNEWHKDTGLVATMEWQETTISGDISGDRPGKSSKTLGYPFLKFRFNQNQAIQPPSSYLSKILIQTLTNKSQIEVAYDPLRNLLLGAEATARYIPASNHVRNPRILIGDEDLFAIDTLPTNLIHEVGHANIENKMSSARGTQTNHVFRNVFGEVRASHPSNTFHSSYLNDPSNGQRPYMSLEETYTYWISVKSNLFNLRQALPRKNLSEIKSRVAELRVNVSHLRAISEDAKYIYDEAQALLNRPETSLNLKRENGKMTLVFSLSPKQSSSKFLKTPRDQILDTLKLHVEIPIELDPPKLWAIRFEEIIGGKSSPNGIYQLPANLRPLFLEHMNGRIEYLKSRHEKANQLSRQLEEFSNTNPEPSLEQLEGLIRSVI